MKSTPLPLLALAATLAISLPGCVPPPPPVVVAPLPQAVASPNQTPFVAVPGPGKAEPAFRADEGFCRSAPTPPAPQGVSNDTYARLTPGVAFLQCMEARGNLVQPLQATAPAPVYAYLQPYPVYTGPWYEYGYPWYYGSIGYGFGYWGGWGGYGYRGWGWGPGYWRGGYGYRGWDGYRGGGGWGGYRGGWGGGYRGGGWRGR